MAPYPTRGGNFSRHRLSQISPPRQTQEYNRTHQVRFKPPLRQTFETPGLVQQLVGCRKAPLVVGSVLVSVEPVEPENATVESMSSSYSSVGGGLFKVPWRRSGVRPRTGGVDQRRRVICHTPALPEKSFPIDSLRAFFRLLLWPSGPFLLLFARLSWCKLLRTCRGLVPEFLPSVAAVHSVVFSACVN